MLDNYVRSRWVFLPIFYETSLCLIYEAWKALDDDDADDVDEIVIYSLLVF